MILSSLRLWLSAIGASIPMIILPIAVLGIPLSAADAMNLTAAETSSWIFAVYGLAGLLSIVLAYRLQQPVVFTGNIFVLIFIASLGARFTWGNWWGPAWSPGWVWR